MEQQENTGEIGLAEIVRMLWRGKALLLGVTGLVVLSGLALYVLLPRTYSVSVEMRPIRPSEIVGYGALNEEKVFPYGADSLFAEFQDRVQDFDLLYQTAMQTGVVERGKSSELEYQERIKRFVETIEFKKTLPAGSQSPSMIIMRVFGSEPKALPIFCEKVLTSSEKNLAGSLVREIRGRAAVIQEKIASEIATLKVAIASSRERGEKNRADRIAQLSEQIKLARSLGIEMPIEMRALDVASQGAGTSVQINTSGDQRSYLQGFAALEEEASTLRNRTDNDPYAANLRELEQKVFVLERSPQVELIHAALAKSPLGNEGMAQFSQYVKSAQFPTVVSPRLSIFLSASVFLGLLLGFCAIMMRGLPNRI